MKQIFYDLETTGTKFWRNGIHQLSGLVVIDGEVKEEFNYHVQPNPKADIEQEALEVAGVTKEQIMAYPPMWGVWQQFTTMLAKYVDKFDRKDKFFLCGYNNAPFDNQLLRAWFVQNGDNYFGSWFWSSAIDVMVLAAQALMEQRPEMQDFKLHTVAEQMGIELDESKLHDAMYDIYITHEVYKRLTF
jgi:DNA polymerase-3 subunit epsilon